MQDSDISTSTSRATQTTPIGVALRGVCMGLAELVPGISGGTIAFVTGIYSELVTALASFGQPRETTGKLWSSVKWTWSTFELVRGLGIGAWTQTDYSPREAAQTACSLLE